MHSHDGNNSLFQLWDNVIGIPSFVFLYTPSDTIRADAISTETSTTRAVTVMKEIQVNRAGKIRVTFEYSHGDYFGSAGISVNGVSKAAYQGSDIGVVLNAWYAGTADVDVSRGDLVQVYIVSFDGEPHSVRNMRLKWDIIKSDDVLPWS